MNVTRRQFLKATAATAAVASVGGFLSPRRAHAFYQSPGIPLWRTTLRGVGPGGIPVALPTPGATAPVTGVIRYKIKMRQFKDQITGGFLDPTTLWGYKPTYGLGDTRPIDNDCDEDDRINLIPRHLGGIIDRRRRDTRSRSTSRTCSRMRRKASISSPWIRPSRCRTRRSTGQPSTSTAAWSPGSATAARSTGSTFRGARVELPEQPGPESESPSEFRRVLLPLEPERPVRLVPRPRPRHHPDQCLCRDGLWPLDPRQFRAGPHQNKGLPQLHRARRQRAPARHPGQDLRRAEHRL